MDGPKKVDRSTFEMLTLKSTFPNVDSWGIIFQNWYVIYEFQRGVGQHFKCFPKSQHLEMLTLKSTFQMLTEQLFLARPSVTQMSNDVHLLGVAGAAGVLAGALPPSH